MKTVFGVVGDPVAHSLSPAMHNAAFEALGMDCAYHAFQVKAEYLAEAVAGARRLGFGGLNVTIPHKEAILSIIEPDGTARDIGAANTIDFRTMKAYNTDAYGALKSLEDAGISPAGKGVLVLGAGGAARAVVYAMAKADAKVIIANRTEDKAAALASYMRKFGNVEGAGLDGMKAKAGNADIIINTTSAGMYPDVDSTLITKDIISSRHTVFDLVYKPLETRLLREAKAAGAKTIDGLAMLARQGERSFEIWTGVKPPAGLIERSARDAL